MAWLVSNDCLSPRLHMLEVLYEDNHCLAVVKPARILTAGDETGDKSLLELAREYLRQRYNKPGNVFVGLVHRLDRPVSGVVVFARTSKAAARLSEQFRRGTVRKTYRAVVEGNIEGRSGEFVDWLLKNEQTNITKSVLSPKLRRGPPQSLAVSPRRHSAWAVAARNQPRDRPQPPDSRATGRTGPPDLRRSQVRFAALSARGHRPARGPVDVRAPHAARTGDGDGPGPGELANFVSVAFARVVTASRCSRAMPDLRNVSSTESSKRIPV